MSGQGILKSQDQWQAEDYRANLKIEFDPDTRIMHVSAHRAVVLASTEQIDRQRDIMEQVIREYGPEPIYLIIDLPRFIIEPSLAPIYLSRMVTVLQQYVHPGGIARYGLNMTRVTVRMAYSSDLKQNPNLFATRSEAEAYIRTLIAKRRSDQNQAKQPGDETPEQASQSGSPAPSGE
jgi:hypothetical protein